MFVHAARDLDFTPHVARKTHYIAVDGRTTRHDSHARSQRRRKIVAEVFRRAKTVGLFKNTRHRGRTTVNWVVIIRLACHNLVRLRTLTAGPTPAGDPYCEPRAPDPAIRLRRAPSSAPC